MNSGSQVITNRVDQLSLGTKLLRITALASVLFLASSTGLSAQADKKAPEDATQLGEGLIVVPVQKIMEIQAGIATILTQKELLEKQLQEAQSTIRNGMGCT
jgi:hypothetical protein